MTAEPYERRFAEPVAPVGTGTVIRYAARWGDVPRMREVWARGAFAATLAESRAAGRWPPLLSAHDTSRLVGAIVELAEDAVGLRVEARLALDAETGREAYALLKANALDGLSVGFRARRERRDGRGWRVIEAVELAEVSLVAIPAVPTARVQEIRAAATGAAPNGGGKVVDQQDAPADGGQHVAVELAERLAAVEKRSAEAAERLAVVERLGKRLDAAGRRLARPVGAGLETRAEAEPVERRAFLAFLRRGEAGLGEIERRALTVSSDPAGGCLVEDGFRRGVVRGASTGNPFRGLARVISGSRGDLVVPRQTAGATVSWVSETADAPVAEPTLGQTTISAHRLAGYTEASNALLEDSAADLAELLGVELGERVGEAEAAAVVSGEAVSASREAS